MGGRERLRHKTTYREAGDNGGDHIQECCHERNGTQDLIFNNLFVFSDEGTARLVRDRQEGKEWTPHTQKMKMTERNVGIKDGPRKKPRAAHWRPKVAQQDAENHQAEYWEHASQDHCLVTLTSLSRALGLKWSTPTGGGQHIWAAPKVTSPGTWLRYTQLHVVHANDSGNQIIYKAKKRANKWKVN